MMKIVLISGLWLVLFFSCNNLQCMAGQVDEDEKSAEELTGWQALPAELKAQVFSFIPEERKHLMLVDNECHDLTQEPQFLRELVRKLMRNNLGKAVKKFAFAVDADKTELRKAFEKEQIFQQVANHVQKTNLNNTQAFMQFDKEAAEKIFVKYAQEDNVDEVAAFLNAGINVNNARNTFGHNALMEASCLGRYAVGQFLLDQGAGINTQNEDGCSPLYFAVDNAQPELVGLLLAHGADVEIKTREKGTTPLILAAELGCYCIVELLLNYNVKADVNAQELDGHTALMRASQKGHLEIVKLLLNHDVKANARIQTDLNYGYWRYVSSVKEGAKTLMSSMSLASKKVMPGLAFEDKKGDACSGYTALMYACKEGHADIARELLEHSDINAQNEYGCSPLYLAAYNGQLEVVELLLDAGAKVEIANKKTGTTPLIISAELGHQSIVAHLLAYDASVDARELDGHTALMHASRNGHTNVVKLLLKYGAVGRLQTLPLHAKSTCYDWTAFMYACEGGHIKIVEKLLGHSDINAKNSEGHTALDCTHSAYKTTRDEKYKKIIDLLMSNGAREQETCTIS